jgi:hypothetical protein
LLINVKTDREVLCHVHHVDWVGVSGDQAEEVEGEEAEGGRGHVIVVQVNLCDTTRRAL